MIVILILVHANPLLEKIFLCCIKIPKNLTPQMCITNLQIYFYLLAFAEQKKVGKKKKKKHLNTYDRGHQR